MLRTLTILIWIPLLLAGCGGISTPTSNQIEQTEGGSATVIPTDDSDLSIYSARREDGTLTVFVVNLSLEEKTKAIRIEVRGQVQAEAWLFDPTHQAENMGKIDITNTITGPPQSITLYIIQ